jgi:hypothetical protein
MLNLDVSTDKFADLKKLFNNANVHYRIFGTSSDGLTTTLKFNKKVNFEKAKEIIDGKVVAQGNLIHANPLGSINIGDNHIDWLGDMGSPTLFGGTVNGDASYLDDIFYGQQKRNFVLLTPDSNNQLGSIAWEKNYNYSKNILVKATTYSSGDSGDGITFFFGADSENHSGSDDNGALAVYIDELNDNTIKVYIAGSLQTTFYTNQNLDDSRATSWIFLINWEYDFAGDLKGYLSVYINNSFQLKIDITSWAQEGGPYIGASAKTSAGTDNIHSIGQFQVMGANPWLAINK